MNIKFKMFFLSLIILTLFNMVFGKSITIICDTTESMDSEIEIIKRHLRSGLEGLVGYEEFNLITFNDPEISSRSFSSLEEFSEALSTLSASNGGHCPEQSVSGIERAIENIKRDSIIFVFTDAYADERGDKQKIIDTCKNKNILINIFLTGRCVQTSQASAGDVNVFYNITRSCHGNVFRLIPSNLTQAISFMKLVLSNEWTEIRNEEPFSGSKDIDLSVEDYATQYIIAVSGDYLNIEELEFFGVSPVRIMDGRQIIVENYLINRTGDYHLKLSGRDVSVSIYKKEEIVFQYGFTQRKSIIGRFSETTKQPILNSQYFIVIATIGEKTKINSLKIQWANGQEESHLVLSPLHGANNMYITQQFIDTTGPFKMSVQAEDTVKNKQFTGLSQVITPVKRDEFEATTLAHPMVEIVPPLRHAAYKGSVTVACRVSLPWPTVQWDIDGRVLTSEEPYLLELPHLYISYVTVQDLRQNSSLTCTARNPRREEGFDTTELFVLRTQEFEVTQSPQDQAIEVGETERIHCAVLAYPEATIRWYHNATEIDQYNDQYEIKPGYLLIKKMSLDNVGTYQCVAANEFKTKTFSAEISISGLDLPEINVSENELILSPGSWKEIECTLIKGLPAPTITWTYKSEKDTSFSSLPEDVFENNHIIKIADAKKSNAGTYRCTAENLLGTDEKDVVVKVHFAPTVKTEYDSLTVQYGAQPLVTLKCEVDGSPDPEVRWEVSRNDRQVPLKYTPDENNTLSFQPEMDDSGDYKCYARNEVGDAMKTISLTVLVAPLIDNLPSVVHKRSGESVNFTCRVLYGYPEPEITWNFIAKNSKHTILERGTRTSVLEISKVSKNNEGQYICRAENIIAVDRVHIQLKVT